MEKLVSFLLLGVPRDQQGVVINVLWRAFMLSFVMWSLGAFGMMGLPGFLWASDAQELEEKVDRLQESADISARISLAQEIRAYAAARCKADDPEPFNQVIERLQVDYERITGSRYPEPRCP
jgi:hypothetical protein